MNLLFFLTPKEEVEYIYDDFTVRQTLEKMEYHKYSEIPVINRRGEYVGTITEGDLLWLIKNRCDLNLREAEEIPIDEIERKRMVCPVSVGARLEDLVQMSLGQNFVPVVDDKRIFIGIVKRKDIIDYFYQEMIKARAV